MIDAIYRLSAYGICLNGYASQPAKKLLRIWIKVMSSDAAMCVGNMEMCVVQ